jgi:hypothetical protein
MAQFDRYIGIDYSGAETPDSSRKGLRVYLAEGSGTPEPVLPPPSPRRYWTRRGLAEWLCEELDRDIPTLVGIDHAFSFPLAYFDRHGLPREWPIEPQRVFRPVVRRRGLRTSLDPTGVYFEAIPSATEPTQPPRTI